MKFVGIIFCGIFYLAFLSEKLCFAMLQPELTPVDLAHSKIVTSPLKSGFNSTELLIPDYSKQPICVVTLLLIPSWFLIDLGFVMSGISQIRLFTDYSLENTHELLTDIEVDFAEYLSPSDYQNPDSIKASQLKRCGNTGTVTQHTSSVVVDCSSPSRVRWVLLKKQGQLHLCHVQILQNTVKPECFRSLSKTDPLYSKAKSNLTVFRSKRHVKHLECLQNCDAESQCEAIAFMPLSQGTGICQLLRAKDSSGDSLCDDSCRLSINMCHLGERVKTIMPEHGDIMKLPPMDNNSFVLSIEINGVENCVTDNCGRISLYLSDSQRVVHHCATIDRYQYRILFNAVFICDKPVRAPREIIFKKDFKNQETTYTYTSIHIRLTKKGSFSHNLMSIFTSTSQLISSTSHTTPSSSQSISSTSHITPSSSQSISSTSQITSLISQSITYVPSTSSADSKMSSPLSSIITSSKNVLLSKPLTVSTGQSLISTSTSITLTETSPWFRAKFSSASMSTTIARMEKDESKQYSDPSRSINNDEGVTNAVKPLKSEIAVKYHRRQSSTRGRDSSMKSQTNHQSVSPSFVGNQSSLVPTKNITAFIFKTIKFERTDFPFLWIIFLLFGVILVLVTFIVVGITFIDGKRKMKQWDIPLGGLCPSENGTGSITVQTSLHVSTTR